MFWKTVEACKTSCFKNWRTWKRDILDIYGGWHGYIVIIMWLGKISKYLGRDSKKIFRYRNKVSLAKGINQPLIRTNFLRTYYYFSVPVGIYLRFFMNVRFILQKIKSFSIRLIISVFYLLLSIPLKSCFHKRSVISRYVTLT